MIASIDPRTGATVEELDVSTTTDDLEALCARALEAAAELSALGRAGRATMLRAMSAAPRRACTRPTSSGRTPAAATPRRIPSGATSTSARSPSIAPTIASATCCGVRVAT